MKLNQVLNDLKEARKHATFENASFCFNDEELNAKIKDATKLFRESWLIPCIDNAIEEVEKEIAKKRK